MRSYPNKNSYIRTIFAPETPAQAAARAALTDPNDQISIYPEEGKFLQLLIHLTAAKKIIEIGTLGGYSTLWMADALPDDGKIITLEKDQKRADIARKNIAGNSKIELIEGDAVESLKNISGPFDIAFIDADKLNYLSYLDWAEKNVRKGGLIIGDNTLLFDAVWKNETTDRIRKTALEAVQTFNRRLSDSAKYHAILLPTTEGMTIAQKLF